MDQRIIDLYDRFTHGALSRRGFLDRLAEIAGSSAAALALLPLLQNDYARAAMVAADDARLAIDKASYDAPGTRIGGYLARLKDKGQTARGHRHPREPRAQPAYRGHGAPAGARRLPRLCGRHALAARRHAGRRRQGARHDRHAQRRPDRAAHRRRRAVPRAPMRNRPARSARSASAGAAAWSTAWRCCRPT